MEVPQGSDVVSVPPQNYKEVPMGRSKLIMKTKCKHTHFVWEERLLLQYHYNRTNSYEKTTSPTLLGTLLNKREGTIRREITRGLVKHLISELLEILVYSAEYAQNDADLKSSAKGPEIKLGKDWDLIKGIYKLIKKNHYSPYTVTQYFNRSSGQVTPGFVRKHSITISLQGI